MKLKTWLLFKQRYQSLGHGDSESSFLRACDQIQRGREKGFMGISQWVFKVKNKRYREEIRRNQDAYRIKLKRKKVKEKKILF